MRNVQTQTERSAEKGVRPLLPKRPFGCFAQKGSDPFFGPVPIFGSPAFSLIEMMVVVGIIVILVAVTMPAMGPMMASNKEAQVLNTLGGLLTNAQATAAQTANGVALRVERAYKTNALGIMVDANGRTPFDSGYTAVPVWLDYQRVRFVNLVVAKELFFAQIKDSKVYDLPANYWLAPDYALSTSEFGAAGLAEANLPFTPTYTGTTLATFNRFDTFYIVFSPAGDLAYYPAAKLRYVDQSQQFLVGSNLISPKIQHPDGSARTVFVYDRNQWKEIDPTSSDSRKAFLQTARSVNINRITGSIVEGKTQ